MLDTSSTEQRAPQRTHHGPGEGAPERTRANSSASGVLSEEEFFDSRSHASSAEASVEGPHTTAPGSVRSHSAASFHPIATGTGEEGHIDGAPKTASSPRFRSLTNSRIPANGTSAGSPSLASSLPSPSTLRRSATAKHSVPAISSLKVSKDASVVEERARRAAKAMAKACTTGMSIRESDERRERAFNHILVERRLSIGSRSDSTPKEPESPRESTKSGSSEQISLKRKPRPHPLHEVPSQNRAPRYARADTPVGSSSESMIKDEDVPPAPSSATPGPDGRTLSMTHDRKAIAIARSVSLEARIGRTTRKGLSRWMLCFGAVNFDVDQGPTLSLLYPHMPFNDSERAAISFSSMPDSTIYELYDSVYTFHFRVDPARLGLPKDQVFLYGHVFFRQKRDPLMRRGGFQKSVVIISHLPYHGLFSRMAHMLGPLFFDLGTAILEAAAHSISSWPDPRPGASLELPFLGTALATELPASDSSQLLETSNFPLDRFDPGEHILASVTCDGLFRSFRDTLADLWACWELMILGEPLVVLADTPARCSEAIVSLVDIIFPITYCGDYRPYFTIQDPDFRAVVSKTHVPANTVVGVSNPFFSEAMSHWPHKLFLGSSDRMSQMHGISVRKARAFGDSSGSNSNSGSGNSGSSGPAAKGTGFSSSAGGSGGGGSSSSRGVKQGLQSKYKCVVSKDRPFAEHLLDTLKTGKQPPWIVNNMLRRHFIDLTVQFLAPLNRYFTTLTPQVHSSAIVPTSSSAAGTKEQVKVAIWSRGHGPRQAPSLYSSSAATASPASLSWFRAPGPLRPWRTDDFMASLTSFGISPQLSNKHSTTRATDVLASVFTGSSGSAKDSSGAAAASNSHGLGGSSNTTNGAFHSSDVLTAHASASPSSTSPSSPSFSLWRGKKSSKKISDEWLQLYTQFLKCGNFATWLAHRTNEAQRALLVRFRQEVCQGDVHAWCRGYDYPLAIDQQQLAAEIEMLDLATMDLGQSTTTSPTSSSNSHQHPHVSHVFYHGQAEDGRRQAEKQRQLLLRERQERLARSERAVHSSDGTLVGYTRQTPAEHMQRHQSPPSAPDPALAPAPAAAPGRTETLQHAASARDRSAPNKSKASERKQLGQRITFARRAQATMLQAAWQVAGLLGEPALSAIMQAAGKSAGSRPSLAAPALDLCPPSKAEKKMLAAQLSTLLEYMPAEAGSLFLPLVSMDYALPAQQEELARQ